MATERDRAVVQSRELIAASRDLLRLARGNIDAAAVHLERSRNLLQRVWLRRELLRRRKRS